MFLTRGSRFRCGTAEPVSGRRLSGGSCHAAGPGVWCTPESEPEVEMGGIPAAFMIKYHHGSGLKGEAVHLHVNSPTSGSHSSHVCGWGSTGWRTAGSACCFSGLHEPTRHRTRKRLEHLDAVCSAAKTSHFRKHLGLIGVTEQLVPSHRFGLGPFVSPHLCWVSSSGPESVQSGFHTTYLFLIGTWGLHHIVSHWSPLRPRKWKKVCLWIWFFLKKTSRLQEKRNTFIGLFYEQKWVCKITFWDGVEVRFLAHGRQQWQGAGVHPYLGVAVILPGVILDHIEQTADQVEHAVLRVILPSQTRYTVHVNIMLGLSSVNRRRIILFWEKEIICVTGTTRSVARKLLTKSSRKFSEERNFPSTLMERGTSGRMLTAALRKASAKGENIS